MNEKISAYFALQQEIFDHVGYVEDWRILPLEDSRDYFWRIIPDGEGGGEVHFADTEELLDSDGDYGDYYADEIYKQAHLPKWVYRGEEFTMIVVDTHTDGNKLLRLFSCNKERPQ